MFHIETDWIGNVNPIEFYKFVKSLGPQTTRQFDQFNNLTSQADIWNLHYENRHNFYGMLDDELIVYAFLQKLAKKKNIVTLGVVMADKYHGHGYGKQMYKYVTDWGLERYTKIWSAVYEDNDAVLHIHKSLGYDLEGVFVEELDDGRSIFSLAKFKGKRRRTRYYELVWKWRRLK